MTDATNQKYLESLNFVFHTTHEDGHVFKRKMTNEMVIHDFQSVALSDGYTNIGPWFKMDDKEQQDEFEKCLQLLPERKPNALESAIKIRLKKAELKVNSARNALATARNLGGDVSSAQNDLDAAEALYTDLNDLYSLCKEVHSI
jgi:hypothetical protein